MRKYGSSGIVYDLSAIRYNGTENDLAGYGHYYHLNGENREINFVPAVTSTISTPTMELSKLSFTSLAASSPKVEL